MMYRDIKRIKKGACVMRISPISVSPMRNNQNYNFKKQNVQNPNFKGWGGALGTIGGALLGVGLTAISGGALAWTIPALSGGCAIGGDMYEHKDKPSSSDFDYDPTYPNYRDY